MDNYSHTNNFFGYIPRKIDSNSGSCLCDHCSTRLRKHDGYLNVYAYQFKSPHDELTNTQIDQALENNGIVPNFDYDHGYGQAFFAKILPEKKPFGQYEYKKQTRGGTVNINPYRLSNDVCEGACCAGDCREYGDALERYLKCREQCEKQGKEFVMQKCGPAPMNPALNGCRKNWTSKSASSPYNPILSRFPNGNK